ncbi:MAG: hypothetical protein WKI04_14425 [Ferruginibacter sp.]
MNQLKEIVVRGQSNISSEGSLLSPVLHVFVEEDCYVSIKNSGMIYIIKSRGTEINVEKSTGDV